VTGSTASDTCTWITLLNIRRSLPHDSAQNQLTGRALLARRFRCVPCRASRSGFHGVSRSGERRRFGFREIGGFGIE
jgi:hypothetical protein